MRLPVLTAIAIRSSPQGEGGRQPPAVRFPKVKAPSGVPHLFHCQRSVETVRLMTPITERLSARATTATERVRFALGCGHVVAVTVAQGNLPIYP